MSLSQGENVSIGMCATALHCGHWVMCLGLREFGKRMREGSDPDRVVPRSPFYREVKPVLASCLISKDSGLPRGARKARESRHTKGKCYLGASFPFPDSLKSLWQRREKKTNEDLHLREKPRGLGLQPGKGTFWLPQLKCKAAVGTVELGTKRPS